jgi:hypothetical protein
MGKTALALCVACFILLSPVATLAADEGHDIRIMLNGIEIVFDAGEQPPILKNDRVLVPLRKFYQALDCVVTYEGKSGFVTVESQDGMLIALQIDKRQAFVNGVPVEMDIAPRVVNGSTLVPLRFVSEHVNARVNWVGETRTVEITTVDSEPDFAIIAGRKLISLYRGTAYDVVVPSMINGFPIDTIGYQSFGNNLVVARVVISEGIKTIEDYAFWRAINLYDIRFPDSLEIIGDASFWGCDKLTDVRIGRNVTAMDTAFANCNGLRNIHIDEGNERYLSSDGIVFDKGMTSIVLYPGGKTAADYAIPYGVEQVGAECFMGHNSLSSISFPDTIRSIGWLAFGHCDSLTDVVLPFGAEDIADVAFRYCENLETIEIPSSVASIGKNAFEGCEKLTIYGAKGSYAESYAKRHGIPFVVKAT